MHGDNFYVTRVSTRPICNKKSHGVQEPFDDLQIIEIWQFDPITSKYIKSLVIYAALHDPR